MILPAFSYGELMGFHGDSMGLGQLSWFFTNITVYGRLQ